MSAIANLKLPFEAKFIGFRQPDGTVLLMGVAEDIPGVSDNDNQLIAISGEIGVVAIKRNSKSLHGLAIHDAVMRDGLNSANWPDSVEYYV